eukprot:GDKH01003666.1.p3 GENE.GDKH01003666.1~~GDKH01003666.1.p3  ORF type:complete len:97 (-),score=4.49 GDKH01003666.1:170-460(-)
MEPPLKRIPRRHYRHFLEEKHPGVRCSVSFTRTRMNAFKKRRELFFHRFAKVVDVNLIRHFNFGCCRFAPGVKVPFLPLETATKTVRILSQRTACK